MVNGRFKDITGQRFGRLLVKHCVGSDKKHQALWVCSCDCGNAFIACGFRLRSGIVKSCGCLRREVSAARARITSRTHGHALKDNHTPEYDVWASMIYRCTNPNHPAWKYYGGRGISVCERWRHSFENFLSDMGFRPTDKHSIDRFPNNDGNYERSNCRWATMKEQAANRRPRSNPQNTLANLGLY